VEEEHPTKREIVHAMAKRETSLFMMVLFVTTVLESLWQSSKATIKHTFSSKNVA
jgi:hypothetical protein